MKHRLIAVVVLMGLLAIVLSGCFQPAGPLARFTATPRFAYPPYEPTFDASASSSPDGAIVSYEWNFGDGQTDTGVIVTHVYEERGTYEVTLIVTDSNGQTGARIEAVEALNRAPTARFTYSPFYVGADQPVRLDASEATDPDGEIVQYLWSFGDGTTGDGMIVEHEYVQPGWKPTITLTVIDDGGASSNTSKEINVVGCDTCGG